MGQSRKNFEGGSDKVIRSFGHIFNVAPAEAQCRMPKLPQRWQSKPSNWTSLTSNWTSLTGALLRKVVDRPPTQIGGFADLYHMTPAPVVVSQDTAGQLDHTDTSSDPSVLPPIDGQVFRCHLSTFLVLSSEYRIAVQAGSAYREVSETRFDELHLTQGDLLVAASTCPHHGMPPPPPNGLPHKGVIFTQWTPDKHHRHIIKKATHLDPVLVPAVKGFTGGLD